MDVGYTYLHLLTGSTPPLLNIPQQAEFIGIPSIQYVNEGHIMSIKKKLASALSILDLIEDTVTIGTDSLRHHRNELKADREVTSYTNSLNRADIKAEAKAKFVAKWDKQEIPSDDAVEKLISKLI